MSMPYSDAIARQIELLKRIAGITPRPSLGEVLGAAMQPKDRP